MVNVVALSFQHHLDANKIQIAQQMNHVLIDSVEIHAIVVHMLLVWLKIIVQHVVVCQDTREIRILCAEQLVVEAIPNVIQDVLVSMETVSIRASLIIHAV